MGKQTRYVQSFSDGNILLRRNTDETLKVWDLRKTINSLQVFKGLPNNYAKTNVVFSPDERLIYTGTFVERDGNSGGLLCFYNMQTSSLKKCKTRAWFQTLLHTQY